MPLRDVLEPRQHNLLFCNVQALENLHAKLEGDLAPAAAADGETSTRGDDETSTRTEGGGRSDEERAEVIAKAFHTLAPFFKMYAFYSANYSNVPQVLAKLAEAADPKVEEILAAAEERNTSLAQLLFRPVQRMCLYPLLFKQAVGWATGALQAQFEDVFRRVEGTLKDVNEDVRDQEARFDTMRVLTSEVRDGAALVTATRTLQHQAAVDMKLVGSGGVGLCQRLGWGRRLSYRWVIFNDGLLVARQGVDAKAVQCALPAHSETIVALEHLGVRPSASSTVRAASASERDSAVRRRSTEGAKAEKPEVLWLTSQGGARGALRFKCWAESEEAMSVIVSKIEALQLARPSNAALPTVSMKRGLEMLADKKKAVSSRLHNVAEAEAPAAEPQRESIAEADDEAPADEAA